MNFSERIDRRGPRRPTATRFQAGVQNLEGRSLLTSGATILLSNGTLEVFGTNLGDTGSFSVQNNMVNVQISNAQGSDDVAFPAGEVSSVLYMGGSGNNTFANNTSLTGFLYGGSGSNTLTGGSGIDFLVASGSGTNVLNAGSGSEYLEAFGPGHNILNGSSGADTLIAFNGINTLTGGTGTTTVETFGGTNLIDGGPGNSTILSFDGSDVIIPEPNEVVYGFR